MSEDNAVLSCCAACGVAEVDDIKLKECVDCVLARYCSDECQREHHKKKHEETCKKRAAELRDEQLFRQPDGSHDGDCPICMIPLPLDKQQSFMMACCSKLICEGCTYATEMREAKASLRPSCPFCRTAIPSTKDKADEMIKKRVEANDPVALRQWGREQYGKGYYSVAFEYFTKAAQLGDAWAHYRLAVMYYNGHGVEKDKGKEIHHLEEAAIGGHHYARFNLGCKEEESGSIERAVKHWIISANLGDDESIKALMEYFKEGKVSKDVLAAALRAHHAAVDATKSPQREAASYQKVVLDV